MAVQEQALALRRAVIASLERDDAQVQVVWEQICDAGSSGQRELSCFGLFLSTQGGKGSIPREGLPPQLLAAYAYGFGWWAEKSQAVNLSTFSYQLSLELAPNRHTADRLTRLLREEGREAEVVAVWDRMAAALPADDSDHWYALGEAAAIREDWELSAWAYEQGGVLSESSYPYCWMKQGRILQRLQNWEDAETAYYRGLLVLPTHYAPYLELGRVNFEEEVDFQAGKWIAQSLWIKSDCALNNYYMAQVLHRLGNRSDAVSLLVKAVDFHSGQPWRWMVQLADWWVELGYPENALEAYTQALAWQPGEPLIEERLEEMLETR